MAEQYITFQTFNDPAIADSVQELFKNNNITCQVENSIQTIDPFVQNVLNNEIRIKIKSEDFEKADKLLLEESKRTIDTIDSSHYLFQFTDNELMEIVTRPDEWNQLDFLLAQKILKERGKEVSQDLIDVLKKQRLAELHKPEESQSGWILFGYFSALLGGISGMFIGWYLYTHKKTLPNGDTIYGYSEKDRKQGRILLLIGVSIFFIWLLLIFTDGYKNIINNY